MFDLILCPETVYFRRFVSKENINPVQQKSEFVKYSDLYGPYSKVPGTELLRMSAPSLNSTMRHCAASDGVRVVGKVPRGV